ncbi:RNA polymerase factor sigma-54 [Virgibacillus litoralis]|uniref:RNA polymerase sigma-54 factor n=1 Tax=Virgibacillus litoralis TaxID=578221 RepID=A0ABS4H863_9BACI|nr:RNA polymerase factor sigma-54 [Virgibacillus litoralis]MBP1947095.1 RNA polymerase sigma-54 factor [Virgibacillus litoralis]
MELGIHQKQTMNLTMTTELRQAIALLQYSTIELSQFIQEQALENPLIEIEEKSLEIRFEDKYQSTYNEPNSNYDGGESINPLDFMAIGDHGQWGNLLEQTQWLQVSDKEQIILRYLILNLDDNGYLPITTSEVADQLAVNEDLVKHSIRILQKLEPIGVGARDLKECLLLQTQEFYPDDSLVTYVIREYLELLADKKWHEISRKLNISLTEVKRIFDCIQTLNPKPCAEISNNSTRYLYPDITIEKSYGAYSISINNSYLPKIQLNQQYMHFLNKKNETSKYIKENYQKYMWLVRSIEQRQNTILKITQVIIEKQQDFLDNGFASLQPLTLKEVAEEIDMHESTVSRAINNKIIRTPNGAHEMGKLFTSKIGQSNGGNSSSTKVKLLLKQLINEEDKYKPHSDQKIADHFKKNNGIMISRRTVAKYREELNILPSSKRKKIV